jgi:hypothetical protein
MKKIKIKILISVKKVISVSLLSAILIAVAGCATDASKQIKAFSDATILTADNTTQAFNLVENNYYNEQVSKWVNECDKKSEMDLSHFNLDTIQPFINTNALQARVAVLTGLKLYAANLSAITGNGSLTNFDQETTKLGQSLTLLDTNIAQCASLKTAPASKEEIQIFTTAINAVGQWIIKWKEDKEAKKAIDEMQTNVTAICQLLNNDLVVLHDQATNDLNQTLGYDSDYILDHQTAFNNNPGEKRQAIEGLAVISQSYRVDNAIFDSMLTATRQLDETHKSLKQAFTKNPTNNINSLISEFSAEAKRISKYYSSLKTTN